MSRIHVLDQITIDQIAAGEVIERPASIVKELVENAIDAGAGAIVVEIENGGTDLIRITDNGCGMERADVKTAFQRHSTSKIRSFQDLNHIGTLGFRGEALSSIAAVAQVELITKTRGDMTGTRYRIAGGREEGIEDTGAPDGTTFLVRHLFYNTPARRKFLKTAMTEASHVGDLMTRLLLSHPEISFQFINNRQTKLHTSGNGNLKDVIYHVYGREIAANLLDVDYESRGVHIRGVLGKPLISRGNRNFENYFVNDRYVKSSVVSRALEDAYKDFSMQHKYPFVVLDICMPGESVDVNVHPAKMELRFQNQQEVYNAIYEAVDRGLHREALIPRVEAPDPVTTKAQEEPAVRPAPQEEPVRDLDYFMDRMKDRVKAYHGKNSDLQTSHTQTAAGTGTKAAGVRWEATAPSELKEEKNYGGQLDLFEEKLLTREALPEHHLIGQVFDTYWLVQYRDSLYIIDQHAAHERVLYERTRKRMKDRESHSQMLSPPIVLNLSMQEEQILKTYMERFTRIGFEIEPFGQESYALRAVPGDLFSIAEKELFLEMLDALADELGRNQSTELVDEKIASMSCKAAVKGKMRLGAAEADALIGELLTLENPYHCPHGRPTIIAMSRRDLEKKFKRIV